MEFNDLREMMKADSTEVEGNNFSWEEEHCPTLHNGFSTASKKEPKFNCLYQSMWFSQGIYLVRLNDKETATTAYLELETLKDFWETIEGKLVTGKLPFRQARNSERNF